MAPRMENPKPSPLPRATIWLSILLVYVVVSVLIFEYHYLDDLARHRVGTFRMRALEEGTGVFSFFIFLPAMFFIANKYLFEKKTWLARGAWHIACAVVFSFAHTTLMLIARKILSPLLGLGTYEYGIMMYRYPR